MPDIRDNSTVEAIARAFTSNGRKKGQALRDVGYPDATSKSGARLKDIYENVRVKDAIAGIDAENERITGVSREDMEQRILKAFDLGEKLRDSKAMTSAARALNSMRGYDQEKAPNEDAARARAERMTVEERALAEAYTNERVLALARDKGIKLVSGGADAKTA